MSLRPRNRQYVDELTERLRQNLSAGAAVDDILLALADACARRAVDTSPATTPERAALIVTYTYVAEELKKLVAGARAVYRKALSASKRG